MKYTKLLVAYDGSEKSKEALEKAIVLVKQNKEISLDIISVWYMPISAYEVPIHETLLETQEHIAKENIGQALETIGGLENKVFAKTIQGYPSTSIIEYAADHDIDLIVIGSRGLGGFQKLILGSVSYHVVQKATCDVLVVK